MSSPNRRALSCILQLFFVLLARVFNQVRHPFCMLRSVSSIQRLTSETGRSYYRAISIAVIFLLKISITTADLRLAVQRSPGAPSLMLPFCYLRSNLSSSAEGYFKIRGY